VFSWHSEPWSALSQRFARFPHALLFHGAAGIGKFEFAFTLAKALLCETVAAAPDSADKTPCGTCPSCRWIAEGNHPDFRLLAPAALMPTLLPNAGGADGEGDDGSDSASDGDAEPGESKKKALSKEIRVDQFRQLTDWFNVSTHRAGRRVVLVYPLDAINTITANTLLKTLEEPAPGTVFLLVTSHLDRIAATIRSRTQMVRLNPPDTATATAWLAAENIADAATALAAAGGMPIAAKTQAERLPLVTPLLEALSTPERIDPVALAETLTPAASKKVEALDLPTLVDTLQRWVSDIALTRHTNELRYFPKHRAAIVRLAERSAVREPGQDKLFALLRALAAKKRLASHPLNARLFVEEMLIAYSGAFR
jgi:DNA polymerase III subunit delta'